MLFRRRLDLLRDGVSTLRVVDRAGQTRHVLLLIMRIMSMATALTACIIDREGRILRIGDAKRRLVGGHHLVGQSLGLGSVFHDFGVIVQSACYSLERLAYIR